MELLEPDFYANGLHGALDISGNVRQWVPDWIDYRNRAPPNRKSPVLSYIEVRLCVIHFNGIGLGSFYHLLLHQVKIR